TLVRQAVGLKRIGWRATGSGLYAANTARSRAAGLALPAGSGGARVKLQFALFAVVLSGCAGQPPAQQPAPDASAVSTAAPSGGAAAAAATTDQPNQKYIKLGYKAVRYDDGYVYCREDAHVGT